MKRRVTRALGLAIRGTLRSAALVVPAAQETFLQSAHKALEWARIDSFLGNRSSPALASHRPCPVCGSIRSKNVFELTDFQFYCDSAEVPKRLNVRDDFCLDCFAVYMNPCFTPYGFSVLAAEAGRSYGSSEGRPDEQIGWLNERALLAPGARVLDIGCFDGAFLARLPSHTRKFGVDIDAPAIERARAVHAEKSIHFTVGDFETFEFNEEAPDTITVLMVLEHLPRPTEVLRKLRSISHANTKLVVEIPVVERGPTNDINGFFATLHTTHFSRQTLAICMLRAGWSIEQATNQPDYNGYRVVASPCEPVSLVSKNVEDLTSVNRSLERWHVAVREAEARLRAPAAAGRWVVWGAGGHTEFLYQVTTLFHADRDELFALVDSDTLKHGKSWRGVPIHSPDVLRDVDWSRTNLLVSSYGGQESITKAALALGVPAERIVTLYDQVHRC